MRINILRFIIFKLNKINAFQLGNYNWLTDHYSFVYLPCPFCPPCSQYPSDILLAIIIIMCISIISHNYADSMGKIGSFFELPNSESFMSSCACVFIKSDRLQQEVWLLVPKLAQFVICIWGNLKVFAINEWEVVSERSGWSHKFIQN